jgi:hypothetical protein
VRVYHGKASAAVTWVERIRAVLADERLVLFAQPMLDLKTGETIHSSTARRPLVRRRRRSAPPRVVVSAEQLQQILAVGAWHL